ncbi:SDR family oxidoreductase [Arthrobacter ginkgonis]|uniref:SDR family oxidoreductase n=1 Tax=Arthrobacter ginkgonis TaxID=1630594 RepID=A0ABP7DI65_9MICC
MNDSIVLITGGGSGIGKSTALALAAEGATVLIADVNLDSAQSVADQVTEGGGTAAAYACDVSSHENLSQLFTSIDSHWGRLDGAVNNAGITGPIGPLESVDPEAISSLISVNLLSVLYCMQFEIDLMKRASKGAIVNTCSIWGLNGSANYVAYSASKHGVAGATKSAALETATDGIRINAVCPGFVRTPMNMQSGLSLDEDQAALRAREALHPMDRFGEPEEIAAGISFLLSEKASFITGHLLSVDGGFVVP